MDKKIFFREQTRNHIKFVGSYIAKLVSTLCERAKVHDHSKLEYPEDKLFEEFTPKLAEVTYGSDEYNKFLVEMKPALDHHYEVNRHHPQFFKDGIEGMNLVDLVEMYCDWVAATKRMMNGGDFNKSIEVNTKRFGLSPQLAQVFKNTLLLLEP